MENNKGQTIFLSVIGIATLLVAIIGATFAYFTTTMSGDSGTVSATTAKVTGLKQTVGSIITETDIKIYPGWKKSANVKVETLGATDTDVEFKCDLVFASVGVNNLKLKVTRKDTNTTNVEFTSTYGTTAKEVNAETGITNGAGTLTIATGKFKANAEKQNMNFDYELEFPETGLDQNEGNLGQTISATVNCVPSGSVQQYTWNGTDGATQWTTTGQ